jgi:hypothetical protein
MEKQANYVGDCCICNRPLIKNGYIDEHHLIPKAKNGKYGDKILIHRVCHEKIHSIWTETELAAYYHTPERIVANPEIGKFVQWIKRKSPNFYAKTKMANSRRR